MGFFIGMTIGIILGAFMMCFSLGASRVTRESEIYMEGYLAGQVNGLRNVKDLDE